MKQPRLSDKRRDVGERLAGADRERGEDREDVALEAVLELFELLAVAVFDVSDDHSGLGERRAKISLPELRLGSRQPRA